MAITPTMMEEMLEKMFLKHRESMIQDIVKALSPSAEPAPQPTPQPAPAPAPVPPPITIPAAPKKDTKYNQYYFWEICRIPGYRGANKTPPTPYSDYFNLKGPFLGAYSEKYALMEGLADDEDGNKKLDEALGYIIDYYPRWNEISSNWKKVFKECNWTEENHNMLLETLWWAEKQEIYRIYV
jgi:hypothetical protein